MSIASFALEAKMGHGVVQLWTESKDGRQRRWDGYFDLQKRRRYVANLLHKNSQGCQEDMDNYEVTISVTSDRRKYMEGCGMGLFWKTNFSD